MQAIRLRIKQNKAHYRKAESDTNKMTYPLPPFSTIIGALHCACGYTSYHPMDISVQGKYHSMQREIYVDHVRLNSTQDDRGILIKLNNPSSLSAGYREVGVALKSQGNSFRKNITISISNQQLYQQYIDFKEQESELLAHYKVEIKSKIDEIKKRIKQLRAVLKSLDKTAVDYMQTKSNLDVLVEQKNEIESDYKTRKDIINHQLSYFGTLTKSIKSYEVLYDVDLVIHIKADESVLADIEDNIYNLTAIGRSEDFIDLIEIKRVTLTDDIDKKYHNADNMAYIEKKHIVNRAIAMSGGIAKAGAIDVRGTVYSIPKNYEIIDNKRVFENRKVCLVSNYIVNRRSSKKGIFVDSDGYIVSLS